MLTMLISYSYYPQDTTNYCIQMFFIPAPISYARNYYANAKCSV